MHARSWTRWRRHDSRQDNVLHTPCALYKRLELARGRILPHSEGAYTRIYSRTYRKHIARATSVLLRAANEPHGLAHARRGCTAHTITHIRSCASAASHPLYYLTVHSPFTIRECQVCTMSPFVRSVQQSSTFTMAAVYACAL